MKEITISELVSKGYTEDRLAKKRFDRKIWLRLLPFIAIFCASGILALMHKVPFNLGFIAGVGSSLGILAVLFVAYRSPVLSRHTDKPMVQYRNVQPGSRVSLETVYVCPESKTYFTRAWTVDGGAGGG